MGNFKDLRVWNDSIELAVSIYKITAKDNFKRDYGLKDQIQRAAVSISSNIAEGSERSGIKTDIYFLSIAKGSAAEVISQLNIAHKIGYLDNEEFKTLEDLAEKIKASIINLMKAKNKK